MIKKHPIRLERLRQIPSSFSWVDHRLVRHNYLNRCDCPSLALYLFLVTVGDEQGLSYYSCAALCRWLKLDQDQLIAARQKLEQADLIAFRHPLYQVLSLPESHLTLDSSNTGRAGQTRSVSDILRQVLSGGVS
jgi:hypothetical protein